MKTKFKIGDEVYFMDFSKPKKGKITGISIFYGEDDHINKRKAPEGGCLILYVITNKYSEVEEKDLFKTKKQLIDSIFSSLE